MEQQYRNQHTSYRNWLCRPKVNELRDVVFLQCHIITIITSYYYLYYSLACYARKCMHTYIAGN